MAPADTERGVASAGAQPESLEGHALLVVDMQHDFCHPDGSLYVPGGEALPPLVNRLAAEVAARGGAVAASLDWHPPDHVSFVTSHPGRQLYDQVHVEAGGERLLVTLFPRHCVADSPGAGFVDGLDTSRYDHVVRKGRQAGLESFSAFHDMARAASTDLADWLRGRGVHTVLVCGVATEYCVRATAMDSLGEGFATAVLTDAVAGVDAAASQAALQELQAAGAVLQRGAELLQGAQPAAGATAADAAPPSAA